MGEILSPMEYRDDPGKAAPSFLKPCIDILRSYFQDELGEDPLRPNARRAWYFWGERLQAMVLEGTSPWLTM